MTETRFSCHGSSHSCQTVPHPVTSQLSQQTREEGALATGHCRTGENEITELPNALKIRPKAFHNVLHLNHLVVIIALYQHNRKLLLYSVCSLRHSLSVHRSSFGRGTRQIPFGEES